MPGQLSKEPRIHIWIFGAGMLRNLRFRGGGGRGDRMGGSAYIGKGTDMDSCSVGIPSGNEPPNTDRRYVIVESVGLVSVLCVFQTMANEADSHEFRLNSGKLRYA